MIRFCLSLFSTTIVALALVSPASAGPVDAGFGARGVSILDAHDHKEGVNVTGISQTRSGGFRVFGQVNGDVGIFAFNPDGSPDRSFHGRGWVLSDPVSGLGANWDMPEALVRTGNQTVVAGGIDYVSAYATYQHQTLSKFNDDGDLDRSFGDRGTTRIPALRRALGVAMDSKGRLITISQQPQTGGRYSGKPVVPSALEVARFTRDGVLDRTFGKKGIRRYSARSGTQVQDLRMDPQNRPLVLVNDDDGVKGKPERQVKLLRFSQDGKLDRNFGPGSAIDSRYPNLRISEFTAFGDGSGILAGIHGSNNDLYLFRFRPDGKLDPGYGQNGLAVIPNGSGSGGLAFMSVAGDGESVLVQWEGRLRQISPGGTEVDLDLDGLAESGRGQKLLTPDGSIYTAANAKKTPVMGHLFPDGKVDTQFSLNGEPQDLIFREGRGIYGLGLIGGGAVASAIDLGSNLYSGAPSLFVNERDGSRRRDFGEGGAADLGQSFATGVGISPGRNGGIRAIGANRSKSVFQINVGASGKARRSTLEDFRGNDYAGSIPTANGGLIAFGEAVSKKRKEKNSAGFRVARYLPDGSLDFHFGHFGVTQAFFGLSAVPQAASIDAQGRVVLAGGFCSNQYRCVDNKDITQKITFVRLDRDGSLDRSFGKRGRVQYEFGRSGSALDVVALGDGRIVARTDAFCQNQCFNGLELMGLRSNGSLDRGFGKGGRLVRKIGRSFEAVKLFRAGRHGIDVAATVEPCRSRPSFGVLRLNRGGRADRRFGGGDGLIEGLPKGMLGGYASYAVKQTPLTVTFGGHLDTVGRYGGAESATGLARLELRARDGKTSLKPCGV